MSHPKILADFHNADNQGRVRLNCTGTTYDLNRKNIDLQSGLVLTIYSEELEAEGVVEFSEEESLWVARIDWDAITTNESAHNLSTVGDIMSKPDFPNLTKGELRTYIINNPSDVEAFQNFVDRFGFETPVQVFDVPKTSAELQEVDVIIAERLRKNVTTEATDQNIQQPEPAWMQFAGVFEGNPDFQKITDDLRSERNSADNSEVDPSYYTTGDHPYKPTLEELVEKITPENTHEEIDWGRPVGQERWWEES
jgi:hypothetical protein